jgi:alkylation response protein AidB-like acyl-CoA dehydrogenase
LLDESGAWPAEQLALCARHGVFRWFVPAEYGGEPRDEAALALGWMTLGAACQTTTFILTQWAAACRRIVGGEREDLKRRLLPRLAAGTVFTTVGISHLTTSRQHLARPALQAAAEGDRFVLDGYTAWVTGAPHADVLVVGAALDDGRQLLAVVDPKAEGVAWGPPARLVALSASHTGPVRFQGVRVEPSDVLAGPTENVMGAASGTGGLQTSALAIGLSAASIRYLVEEAGPRHDLAPAAKRLASECRSLADDLLQAASGIGAATAAELRTRANSLALRSTQAALSAAKGAGYVVGHPAGRWCREALFFLVWSCPQAVLAANLCELAGIDG